MAGGSDDQLWFAGTNLHSLAAMQAAATFNAVTGATTITYNGTNTVTLNGISPGQLVATDCVFT